MIERLDRRDSQYPRSINYSHSVEYDDHFDLTTAKSAFSSTFEGDCYTFGIHRYLYTSLVGVTETIAKLLTPVLDVRPVCTFFDNHSVCLSAGQKFLLAIEERSNDRIDIWETANRPISVLAFGDREVIVAAREIVNPILAAGSNNIPTIKWHYNNAGRRGAAKSNFQQPKPMYDAFYPWIKGGVAAYFDAYIKSDESVLVLLGEPGTGKTSFIRNLIWHTKWDAAFTYDEDLLKSDEVFVEFMTQDEENLLVIEDADVFLTSRQYDANKLMARFLNVSDGLFTPNHPKKLIFTANLKQPKDIDNALLREGRCFDCLMFRSLSYPEALAAADAAGIEPPRESRNYTLAELFANKTHKRNPIVGVGFHG